MKKDESRSDNAESGIASSRKTVDSYREPNGDARPVVLARATSGYMAELGDFWDFQNFQTSGNVVP